MVIEGQYEYYLSESVLEENNAGNKARVDAAEIFKQNGITEFVCRRLQPKKNESLFYKLRRFIDLKSGMRKMESLSGARIYVQYPIKVTARMLPSYKKMVEKNQIVYLVHDVESVRLAKEEREIKNEISRLNEANTVILHNNKMISYLKEQGLQCKATNLRLFDYLKQTSSGQKHSIEQRAIAFAGNLDKSHFMTEWISMQRNYTLELYGLLSQEKLNTYQQYGKLIYHGSMSPNVIVEKIEGSFGLVWDGISVETCDGSFGEYLKFNNPHKCSLYIASGMPVIVWSKSALADFVREFGVGVCIKNLHEIEGILKNMANNEYDRLLDNVKKIQEQVANGSFLSNCIKAIRSSDIILNQ